MVIGYSMFCDGGKEGARCDEEIWEWKVEGEKRSGKKSRLWGKSKTLGEVESLLHVKVAGYLIEQVRWRESRSESLKGYVP
jgi:hypothetical protein